MRQKTSNRSARSATSKKATGWGGARENSGGSRIGSGRKRRATCQRNGRVYVALDKSRKAMVESVREHIVVFEHCDDGEYIVRWFSDDGLYHDKHTKDYAAAAAEFVRRVNEQART